MSYLRELRKKKKLTAEKMAEILGISVPYLYDLENGRRRLNQDLLKKLREKFGVSADYILDGKQTVPIPPDAIPVEKMVRIPVYGEIRAGEPAFVRDEIIDWAYIPAEQVICFLLYFFTQSFSGCITGCIIAPGRKQKKPPGPVRPRGFSHSFHCLYPHSRQYTRHPAPPAAPRTPGRRQARPRRRRCIPGR